MKQQLALIFGGPSCEHQVSVVSARSMLPFINADKFEVHCIGVSETGVWRYAPESKFESLIHNSCVDESSGTGIVIDPRAAGALIVLESAGHDALNDQQSIKINLPSIDVYFPVVHGQYGEDGILQGLLETSKTAYVGCGVYTSAIAMDKITTKQIVELHGIKTADYIAISHHEYLAAPQPYLDRISYELSFPVFVKPSNMGSSVGIRKVDTASDCHAAIENAFQYDARVLVETGIEDSHEVECAVLGNSHPRASVVGEVIPSAEFYDYEAKYNDASTLVQIPAKISESCSQSVRAAAEKAFSALNFRGLARIDCFVGRQAPHTVVLNEVNTMPGFTPISMYPQLWEATGLSYSELIDELVALAFEEHANKQSLKSHVDKAPG